LLVVLSFVLVACGGGATPTEAPSDEGETEEEMGGEEQEEEEKVVNIFGAFVDEDAKRFEASMVPFEEETGIQVEYEGSGDFETLILVRLEGGDPPDIAAHPQPGLLQNFVEQGHVIDLNDWFEEGYLEEQYKQSWLDLATMNGQMSGVWYRASVKSLVWYPVPEFEEAGYEIPTTWDEMLALSDQIAADGTPPWCIGIESSGATGWVATDWIEDIMLRTQPAEKYDQWTSGEHLVRRGLRAGWHLGDPDHALRRRSYPDVRSATKLLPPPTGELHPSLLPRGRDRR
jgi:alpha-glucoside transport system substrate-binding protein